MVFFVFYFESFFMFVMSTWLSNLFSLTVNQIMVSINILWICHWSSVLLKFWIYSQMMIKYLILFNQQNNWCIICQASNKSVIIIVMMIIICFRLSYNKFDCIERFFDFMFCIETLFQNFSLDELKYNE